MDQGDWTPFIIALVSGFGLYVRLEMILRAQHRALRERYDALKDIYEAKVEALRDIAQHWKDEASSVTSLKARYDLAMAVHGDELLQAQAELARVQADSEKQSTRVRMLEAEVAEQDRIISDLGRAVDLLRELAPVVQSAQDSVAFEMSVRAAIAAGALGGGMVVVAEPRAVLPEDMYLAHEPDVVLRIPKTQDLVLVEVLARSGSRRLQAATDRLKSMVEHVRRLSAGKIWGALVLEAPGKMPLDPGSDLSVLAYCPAEKESAWLAGPAWAGSSAAELSRQNRA
jgi:Holliday junction resolvase-like predicted endonuclease